MQDLLSPFSSGAGTGLIGREVADLHLRHHGSTARRSEAQLASVLAAAFGGLIFTCSTLRGRYTRRIQALESEIVRLSEAADRDHLTGVGNRRSFDRRLAAEWRRALRHNAHLTLALVDIDLFKSFNDAYGHPAGDRTLRDVAQCINRTLGRAADCAFRVGGEEFALILPDTDWNGATIVAERVRQALQDAALPHECSPTGTVTISFGSCSTLVRDDEDSLIVLSLADKALYRAKREGRNRAVCHHRFSGIARRHVHGNGCSIRPVDVKRRHDAAPLQDRSHDESLTEC